MGLLSIFTGPLVDAIGGRILEAYKLKLSSADAQDAKIADLAAREMAVQAQERKDNLADPLFRLVRFLFVLPFVIYAWKIVFYDKVLGIGVTDPLGPLMSEWAGMILTTIFGGGTLEYVAKVFRR